MALAVERVRYPEAGFHMRTAVIAVLVARAAAAIGEGRPLQPGVAGTPSQAAAGGASRNPACAVLTVAEIRSLTGFPGYRSPSPGDAPGQGAGRGASCQFESTGPTVDARGNPVDLKGPLLSIVLIEGNDYTRTAPVGTGCKKEAAPGVGDMAYFEVCPTRIPSRTPPLYVKAGTKDLIVQMDIEKPETDASMRPRVIAVAKAAAAKLR